MNLDGGQQSGPWCGRGGRPGIDTAGQECAALAPCRLAGMAVAQDAPCALPKPGAVYSPDSEQHFPAQVFFGDTQLHTAFSPDAGLIGATLTPDDAFRFARGKTVMASTGRQPQPAAARHRVWSQDLGDHGARHAPTPRRPGTHRAGDEVHSLTRLSRLLRTAPCPAAGSPVFDFVSAGLPVHRADQEGLPRCVRTSST